MENKQTLCWDCARAVCGCTWSREFIPVNGWMAEETKLKVKNGDYVTSYHVISCPEFVPDARKVVN